MVRHVRLERAERMVWRERMVRCFSVERDIRMVRRFSVERAIWMVRRFFVERDERQERMVRRGWSDWRFRNERP